jgi:hypothetical protein
VTAHGTLVWQARRKLGKFMGKAPALVASGPCGRETGIPPTFQTLGNLGWPQLSHLDWIRDWGQGLCAL